MEKIILLHGSGHGPESWEETAALLPADWETLRPGLSAILGGREAGFENLRGAFANYCAGLEGPLHLCGLSLGGILALDYALAHPERVKSLVLIGTPHRVPKAAFAIQNLVFRLLPESAFRGMAFNKRTRYLRVVNEKSRLLAPPGRRRLPRARALRGKRTARTWPRRSISRGI